MPLPLYFCAYFSIIRRFYPYDEENYHPGSCAGHGGQPACRLRQKNAAETGESDSNKLSVVTTIFPEYDWVREILGDKAESTDLTMLLNSGVDLHSYQPTADDIVKISDCDLFVYVGGESDGWVESVLKNAVNKKMKVINLLEMLGDSVKTEETVEGMQEAEHAHDHSKEVSTFEDHEVQDRSLSDWAGIWQSLPTPLRWTERWTMPLRARAEEDEDSSTTKDTYLEKYKAAKWQLPRRYRLKETTSPSLMQTAKNRFR